MTPAPLQPRGAPGVAIRAHATFANSEVTRWAFPAHRAVARDCRDWYRRQISAVAESAIRRLRPSTEQRARTTTVALATTAQNGTSGVLADGTQARCQASLDTRRPVMRDDLMSVGPEDKAMDDQPVVGWNWDPERAESTAIGTGAHGPLAPQPLRSTVPER